MHTGTGTSTSTGTPTRTEGSSVVVLPGHSAGDRPRLRLRAGRLAPRVLATGPGTARLALVATTATLLGGDAVELEVTVGERVRLELEDIAATVCYDGRGRSASWSVRVRVAPGGCLVWRTQPFVVASGAAVTRALTADVEAGGQLVMRDAVVLGRHGEPGGSLRCRTTISYAAAPLLIESLDLSSAGRGLPGVLGRHRVVDTLTAVGEPLPAWATGGGIPAGAERFELAGPGVFLRHLGSDVHASPLTEALP